MEVQVLLKEWSASAKHKGRAQSMTLFSDSP